VLTLAQTTLTAKPTPTDHPEPLKKAAGTVSIG